MGLAVAAKPIADYSFARPRDYAELARAVSGVMRYTSNSYDNAKNITADEYAQLAAHGIPVGITWENQADSMLGGASAGKVAAQWSESITRKAGMPDGVSYYAADRDFTLGGPPVSAAALTNCHKVADFLDGAASVTGWDQVGVYGSLYLLQWLRANTPLKAGCGWQTAAWSGGRWANYRWSGTVDPIAGFVQNEFWSAEHPITISGCPVDLSTVTGLWRPRTTAPTNGDISMADAASLHTDIQNFANLVAEQFTNTNKDIQNFANLVAAQFAKLNADVAEIKAQVGAK